MAYTKNNLAVGAVISKAALDNMENGIAAAAVLTDVQSLLSAKANLAGPNFSGTPTINGVAIATTANSGGSGSSTSTSTIYRPETYGGKGDGIVLNDLTVSAGNVNISAASAPFVSTTVDQGKIVYWLVGGGTVESGTISSVSSPTQATLVNSPTNGSAVPGGPNTNGIIGTDNTNALNQALTAIQANKVAAISTVRDFRPAGELHLSKGVYLTKPLSAITQVGVTIKGEGKYATWLASCETGSIISLSPFSTTADTYAGTATHFTARDIHFMNPCFRSGGTENQRLGTAIQDNGSGNLNITECYFTGYKYGVCLAYGSDFDVIEKCYFEICDVGMYIGGGSQQILLAKNDFYFCREAVVSEGSQQWHMQDQSFENSTIADINIEAKSSGNTRMGLPVYSGSPGPGNGYFYAGMWTIDNSWFESNAGGFTFNGIAPRHIWLNGQGPNGNYQERLTVRDCILVSGGSQQSGGTYSFIEVQSAYAPPLPVILSNMRIGGNHLNYVVRNSGSGGNITPKVEDVALPSNVAMFSSGINTTKYTTV